MYWSSTDCIVKTTLSGTMISQIHIDVGHTGDIDYYDGKLYVTVLGKRISSEKEWSSFSVHVYDPKNLSLIEILTIDNCQEMYDKKENGFRGIDGITVGLDKETQTPVLMIACLLCEDPMYDKCIILQCDFKGRIIKKHYINIGNTCLGIQNLDYDWVSGKYWFTTYGGRFPYQNKNYLFHLNSDAETIIAEYRYCTPVGFHALGDGRYYASLQDGINGHKGGYAFLVNEEDFKTPLYGEEYKNIKEKFTELGL